MFMTRAKNDNENKVYLNNKTYPELQELLVRQNKLLRNNRFVEALPDKGEKLKNFQAQIEEELNKRVNAEQLCKDMLALNIGKDQLDTLEWTGKHLPNETSNYSQSDVVDEDRDILKMFVSHSGVNQDKIIIKEKSEELLIKPSDLIDVESTTKGEQKCKLNEFPESGVERYANNLCNRIEKYGTDQSHLLLNKPAVLDKYSAPRSGIISYKESFMLEFMHEKKLKELNKARTHLKFNTSSYRDTKVYDEDGDEDDDDDNDIPSDDTE